jgi:hypothetical protein
LEGTLTATVEVAGPFKVEGKPLSIHIESSADSVKENTRNWMPVLGIFLVLMIVVILVTQRKTQQPNE